MIYFLVLYPKEFYAWVHVHLLLQSSHRNMGMSAFRSGNMCIFNVDERYSIRNVHVCVGYMFVSFSIEVLMPALSYLLFLYGVLPCNTWMFDHESTMAMAWIDLMVYAALNA